MASPLTHRRMAIASIALLTIMSPGFCTAQGAAANPSGSASALFARSIVSQPLTLGAALELALRNQPDLRVAEADLAILRADSAFAGIPAFNPVVELQAGRGGPSLVSGSEHNLELAVSQELELGGKRDARMRLATARARAGAAEWGVKLQALESDVRARFGRALFLQDRLRLVNELAELDRHVVRSAQARVLDGSMTPVTGRLTETDLLLLEAQGRRVHVELRQSLVMLGIAIGWPLPDSTRLAGTLQVDSLRAPEDSVVARALSARRAGGVLQAQIAVRRAELHLAEREAHPNITVGLGLARERRSFSHEDFSGDPAIVGGIAGARSTDDVWTARVSAPLALRQKNQAGRARASAEIVRSEAELVRYRIVTELEVLSTVRRFADATGLYQFYLDRSTHVRQDLGLIREAYADGRISLDSYLTQKGRLVDMLLGQLEAADAYWTARGELESAVGLDLEHINERGGR